MAIGKRIRFFRNLRGMTQKYLGMPVDFSEKTVNICLAQYESDSRTPKVNLTNSLAKVFGVSIVPEIDSYNCLFTLEHLYGFLIDKNDGEFCIRLDKGMDTNYLTIFSAWREQAKKLKNGEISKEKYDNWRYDYPESISFNSRKED